MIRDTASRPTIAVTDEYLDRLQDTYVEAARLAARAGFDGVDVKSCHRYLVSELLASHAREGKYGGSFENRTRFLREVMGRIRDEVPGLFVTTRMNVYDAISYPYGFGVSTEDYREPDLREPIDLIRGLRRFDMPLVNVTIGNPYYNPHYGPPFDRRLPAGGSARTPARGRGDSSTSRGRFRSRSAACRSLAEVTAGCVMMPYVAAGVVRAAGPR